MSTVPTQRHLTIEEYFRFEERSVEKHDYLDGEVFCMAGGTSEQSAIVVNLTAALVNSLKGTPCRPYDSNLRVGVPTKAKFVYPDVQVVCGPLQHDPRDPARGTILNPRVVIEVLSKSTEAYDRGRKFEFYRDVESMQEYVLVSQREPLIETFLRRGPGEWAIATERGSDARLQLRSLNISIPLSDIYDSVAFTSAETGEAGELMP